MMAKRSRILIGIAALALGLMYILPVWTIELEAPQYPEGIGMVIRLHTIEGQKQHDLQNINGLNHYIGMQAIEPDSIPELRWMPIIAAVLIVTGIGTAALGRRRVLYAWTAGYLTISVIGPLAVAPLFIVSRLLGQMLHACRFRVSIQAKAQVGVPLVTQPPLVLGEERPGVGVPLGARLDRPVNEQALFAVVHAEGTHRTRARTHGARHGPRRARGHRRRE